ncbi:hypothetical protein CMT41_17600 [Colwellia sp. MT41]|uniref:Xanthine permease n=1 Tax=Colwellia marinimaniae TaxID=1513592 RepID=A0ABQ0MXY3_9GAMM|nr:MULTISPECIES: hypothetical protein [Colwellia]ALO36350.1 hypothetical protein CMT41_17600 [Colwellia sp. MT41]GAW97183.1 xanthine permease [Colwellia marinimaniae]
MKTESSEYKLFHRSGLSAFWPLFTDNVTNVIALSAICIFVFNLPTEIVFGRIVPSAAIAIFALCIGRTQPVC